MNEYDFKNLSSVDFEILIQDLLQKEMSITFESFTNGSDGGVDLRHIQDNGERIIVQCKHYSRTPYSTMISQLRASELQKVQTQNPERYIFATSFELTPIKKKEIHDTFKPFCKLESDVYGKNDINNLLRKYPEIEKAHFKLWLSSTTVLQLIAHSAVFNQTDSDIEKIKRKLNFYVQNESYFEALKILNKENYCIVAGIPGIGKTTLAEVILVRHLDLGYEGIEINSDISEAFGVLNKSKKQIFLYDDFLGQTSFQEKLNKNEEQNLLRFIDTVKHSPNTKFLLTTREYILNQAKQSYEKLDHSKVDINKCVITLDKYTRYNKARILYNHLYFSDLPNEYIRNLLIDKNYKKIINHKNFTPRIIQWMTQHLDQGEIKNHEYYQQFIANLDNPQRLWDHAFNYQLSTPSRHLLLVLATMPTQVFIEDLEIAFNAYYTYVAKTRNFSTDKYDFKRALKELESNFIRIEKKSENLIVEFHNPSIKDFIEYRLSSEVSTIEELCHSIIFYDQISQIWNVYITNEREGIKDSLKYKANGKFVLLYQTILDKIHETFENEGCKLSRFQSGGTEKIYFRKEFSLEDRLEFAFNVSKKALRNSAVIIEFITPLIRIFIDSFSQNRLSETFKLVTKLSDSPISSAEIFNELLFILKDAFINHSWQLEHYNYFLGFRNKFPGVVITSEFNYMKKEFRAKSQEEIDYYKRIEEGISSDVSSDDLTYAIDEIATAASQFGFNFNEELEELKQIAKELEEVEMEKRSIDYSDFDSNQETTYNEKDIESLFDSLNVEFS